MTQIVVSDIEGCLLPSKRSAADLANLSLVAHYCKTAQYDPALPRLVVCTGRSAAYVEAVIQTIDGYFPGFPSIVENGIYLFDPTKKKIDSHPLLTAEVRRAIQDVHRELERFIKDAQAKKEYGKETCISLNPLREKPIEQLFEETKAYLAEWSEVIEITHSKSAVDITPKGIDKGSGVKFLAEYTGIEPNRMLGIGDTRGDLTMLEMVGIPTCPENASEEVKDVVKYCASRPEAAGVVDILRKFTLWQ